MLKSSLNEERRRIAEVIQCLANVRSFLIDFMVQM